MSSLALIFFLAPLVILFSSPAESFSSETATPSRRVSIVTGANGYVGKAIVHELLQPDEDSGCSEDEVMCLVREQRVKEQVNYWENDEKVRVMPYDMLDGGKTLDEALKCAYETGGSGTKSDTTCCIYHVASVFGPTEDHKQTALDNVMGTEAVIRCAAKYAPNIKVVVTSSMAAVRATDQTPTNGKFYTHEDWNAKSELGKNWGQSYQWSKAESERRAWEISKELEVDMASLCPSFVFGPPAEGSTSSSYSIALVGQWVRGESEVQSRLCVDVRDAALAHVRAGRRSEATGKRYILSSEARLSSVDVGDVLKMMAKESGLGETEAITCDTNFDGGAIKIGDKEVDATARLESELGVICRPNDETFRDMAEALLKAKQ
mmetsp:Transcript_13002/g.37084  ORF Transcript_13002/g.37084 Transcript_13002/m.37084 type:complete len:378 (+) Transcript_13002:86-1219(+)